MSTKLKDVAVACGVSLTTVSLVLNNRPNRISESTKSLILETAEKMNYRANQIAVSMITKRTNTIGLILPDISNTYFSELAKSIEENAYKVGYNILYGNTSDSAKKFFEYLHIFIDRSVDAIIVIHSNEFIEQDKKRFNKLVSESNIPILVLDRPISVSTSTSVLVDQQLGGYLATKHLLDWGHKKIGCLTGPNNLEISNLRLSGYKDALKEANISFDPNLLYSGNFHADSSIQALPHLLGQNVSAVFAFNDMMAIGLIHECKRHHIKIPKDLSIIGYDDIFLCELVEPSLTSIYQPIKKIGEAAIGQLLSILNEDASVTKNVVLNPTLNIRRSTTRFMGE